MGQIADRVLEIIKHYKLWPPILLGFAEMLLYIRLETDLEMSIDNGDQLAFYTHGINVMLWAIWIAVMLIHIMHIRYRDKTGGRSFVKDRERYGRSYGELISYFQDADPYRMDVKGFTSEDWKHSEGIIFGRKDGKLIKRSAFEKGGEGVNICLFGLPGSGKTACGLIPTALVYGGSVLAIDIKGDILHATQKYRNIRIFAPDDPGNSCHYNPLSGINQMNSLERRIYIEQIAAVLIPEEREKYWYKTGRSLFTGIALYLIDQNSNTTLPDIAQAIVHGDAVNWIKTIRESDCMEAKAYTDSLYGSNETNLAGAYGSLSDAVRPFSFGSMAELLRDDEDALSTATLDAGYDIYIEIPQDKIQVYAPITTIMVQDFMTAFMRRPDKSSGIKQQPVLFLLDEFPQLKNFDFDTLSNALSTLRSRCVSIVLAQQSIMQLFNRFSEERGREIIDTTSYIAIYSIQDDKSRNLFKNIIGSRKVLKTSTNVNNASLISEGNGSSGIGSHEDREPIFQEGDFSNLGNNVIIYALGKYILAEKIFWFK